MTCADNILQFIPQFLQLPSLGQFLCLGNIIGLFVSSWKLWWLEGQEAGTQAHPDRSSEEWILTNRYIWHIPNTWQDCLDLGETEAPGQKASKKRREGDRWTQSSDSYQKGCYSHNTLLEITDSLFTKFFLCHKIYLHPDLTSSCPLKKTIILILSSAFWTPVKAAGILQSSEGPLKIGALSGH